MHRRRDWTSLPVEILQLISENLHTNFIDLYLFRSVCKSWGLIQLQKPQNPPPQLPWLLLPSLHNNRPRFYSISDNKIYHLPPSDSFNQFSCCRRSSLGCLLIIEENTLDCSLFNPLTGVRVLLPSIRTVYDLLLFRSFREDKEQEKLIGKVVLSTIPNVDAKEEVIVMLLYRGTHLIYLKLGDNAWKRLSDPRRQIHGIEDVICLKGRVHVVDSRGQVFVCDLASPLPSIQRIHINIPKTFQGDSLRRVVPCMNYLVESLGELLLIRRFQEQKLRRTVMFKIFKEDPNNKSWEEIKSLSGHALFLGYNQSLSVLASNYLRCKANCIYFTDNVFTKIPQRRSEPHGVGIFNLESGIIELLPGYWCDHQFLAQPPVFITPSPW
ncbi:hypothetical protein ACHQM5_007171 [Ranunculus cassubicifolius]